MIKLFNFKTKVLNGVYFYISSIIDYTQALIQHNSFSQARVRPLMSRQVESSHGVVSRGVAEVTSVVSDDHVREGVGRLSSGRVVSAVGAVLKRPHAKVGRGSVNRCTINPLCIENAIYWNITVLLNLGIGMWDECNSSKV